MSRLDMLSCKGCGATTEPGDPFGDGPNDWLTVKGNATEAEDTRREVEQILNPVKRHACSPRCLVVLAERLVGLPGAFAPKCELAELVPAKPKRTTRKKAS